MIHATRSVQRKIRFIAIKEAIEFDGKQDLRTKVMIALFGLFAEVERDLISERTKEGLAAAKAKGETARPAQGGLGNIQARRQGARHPSAAGQGCLQGLDRQDTGRLPLRPLPLHPDPQDRSRLTPRLGPPLCCISTRMWALPLNSASLQIGPQQSRARSGEANSLTARTDLESFRARERGIQEEALKQGPAPTPATGKSMSVATARIP